MAIKNPDGLDLFARGRPFPSLAGKQGTLGLDTFARGRVYRALVYSTARLAPPPFRRPNVLARM